jgi:hypothetical protein
MIARIEVDSQILQDGEKYKGNNEEVDQQDSKFISG